MEKILTNMKDLKYKLIISDFDGTLTSSYFDLVDEVTEAVKEYRKAGGKFALCSGRAVSDTSKVLGVNGFECDAACFYQGAIVHVNGEPILKGGVDISLAYDILSAVDKKWKRKYLAYIDDVMYASVDDPETRLHTDFFEYNGGKVVFVEDYLEFIKNAKGNMPKFIIIKGTDEDVSEIYKFIEENYGDKVCVNSGSPWFIEVISNKYTKGTAARLMAEKLGISEEYILTIGDSTNDLSMVQFGCGFAVASGSEKLKAVAKHIAPPIKDMPVKYLIDKVLKGEEF